MRRLRFLAAAAIAVGLDHAALAQRAAAPPSVSVRPPDFTYKVIAGAATPMLGWKVGLPASAVGAADFHEAAGKVDALQFGYLEVSPQDLDFNMSPDDASRVVHRLAELRLRLTAYRVPKLPADAAGRKKIFEFAKLLGVEMILASPDPAALLELDALAGETGVNVALVNGSRKQTPAYWEPTGMLKSLEGRSQRIGVAASVAAWMSENVRPEEALRTVHGSLMAVSFEDRRAIAAADAVLLELSKLQPPEAPQWPWKCANCGGPRVPVTPLFVSVAAADQASIAAISKALLPAMGYRVNEISRKTPSTSIDQVPPAEREAIEAGLPRQALAKPKKPRKLLVIDLCPQGGYYHKTAAHANLALTLMGKNTGAFEPVFNNDLNNLKYPAIRQFDAVFLNSTAGELFSDPEVLAGLTRFVREGGGLAGIHGATYASMILPEFSEMIGAADGPHRVEQATIKIDDPASPLTRAFGGKGLIYEDEFYHFLPTGPFSRAKLHVLLSLDTEKSDMSTWNVRPDKDYGLSWIRNYGKGRVFNCALGHTPTLFATPALATLILGGVQFVLGDLEADATPSIKPSSVGLR